MPRTILPIRRVVLAVAALAAGCAPASPGVGDAPATAPSPAERWTPPTTRVEESAPAPVDTALPGHLAPRRLELSLGDFVDLALERSPDTRAAWATARAQAASYGAAQGEFWPELLLDVGATTLKTAATQGRSAVKQTVYGPTASLTWLLLDLGGRSGRVGTARNALLAADWTHNAAIADVVRNTSLAFYDYVALRALVIARRQSLREAEVNLAASEDRRRVGVATVADVLQAQTARAQARLLVQQTEGDMAVARGVLAVAAGLPPTAELEADSTAGRQPVAPLADSVEALIAGALAERPDLAAARANVDAARERARATRAARYPSLAAVGQGGRTFISPRGGSDYFYSLGLGLSVPVFNGFTWEYNTRAARELADAEAARTERLARDVSTQVFTAYHALGTAVVRARTSDELRAAAEASAEAARARYKEGVGSIIELLAAENALADARAQQISARLTWYAAVVDLAHASARLEPDGTHRLTLDPAAAPPDTVR
jgi:outer membrane protein